MRTRLLVCDLDNTLYDWVGFFVPSFYAMVEEAVRILGCDQETLLDELKRVHQRYHDAEHPFALLETELVDRQLKQLTLAERRGHLDPAFKVFNSTRKKKLQLYPGVESTLRELQSRGMTLVAHTESRFFGVAFRVQALGLVDFFEKIYCLERPARTLNDEGRYSPSWQTLPVQKFVELSHHQRKPNASVLEEICRDENVATAETAYIGDSLVKDVFMAKEAGTVAIWAKYGTDYDRAAYEMLVRVTHWTPEEVARESQFRTMAANVTPDFIAEKGFDEVLGFL